MSAIGKSLEEETQRAAAQVQLQKYGVFFEEYFEKMGQLQETLKFSYLDDNIPKAIKINYKPEENISITELINSDNKIIDKVLSVFCALSKEVNFLREESERKYFKPLSTYGDKVDENTSYEDGQLLISELLPLLQDLSNFTKHCNTVILEIMWQLSSFYELSINVSQVHLQTVYSCLADILTILATIEQLIASNDTLIYHWSLYRKTIQLASHSASQFSYEISKIARLDKLIDKLEKHLLTKKIFDTVLTLPFDKRSPVSSNKILEGEMLSYIKASLVDISKDNNILLENVNNCVTKILLLYILHVNVFCSYDKKTLMQVTELTNKCPLVSLYCNAMIETNSFLVGYLGHFIKANEKKNIIKQDRCKEYSVDMTMKLNRELSSFASCILTWILQIEDKMKEDSTKLKVEYVKDVCALILKGIHLSCVIKMILLNISNVYMIYKKPMNKSCAISLCKLTQLLKCIDWTYRRHHYTLSTLTNYSTNYMLHQCLTTINQIKSQLLSTNNKNLKDNQVDAISCLVVAEDVLYGPSTQLRILIGKLCTDMTTMHNRTQLPKMFEKLCIISQIEDTIAHESSCDFFYINKQVLPVYLNNIISDNNKRITHVKHLFAALQEANVEDEVLHLFANNVIDKICQKLEEDLRMHTLQHLQLNEKSLQSLQSMTLCNLDGKTNTIYYKGKRIRIKWYMENYLNKTFYDLTSVALHDWNIYNEMRTLAKLKFNLQLMDDNLPSQTLEQGLDLLEITRNLDTFVNKYYYNLNNQIFIEAYSNNKYLNTITISHIGNSIKTHGSGIINTLINYTYQFLSAKLNTFSQLLYDEQIKSRLLKDINTFSGKYSFERADRINKSLGKFVNKSNNENTSYLEQFRILITHIGNALGYVRIIRSAALRYYSNSISFIPNLKNIPNFEKACLQEGFSQVSIEAAQCLDDVLANLTDNVSSQGTNYFQLLVQVFKDIVNEKNNNHLKNFYILVPALTINFVTYMIMAKDAITKKRQGTFTDDGFVMGLAYLLKVLNLNTHFDSLQWFHSVDQRNKATKEDITKQQSSSLKEDKNLHHTLALSLKRLEIIEQEFTLLFYNLYSARVLFNSQYLQS